MEAAFRALPSVPDHLGLEREILDRWDAEDTFGQLRERNRGGPRCSFIDGPITANNPMGAHHCWGRTLKDVFQRYKAMRGFDQRYQNGFDCQGLWVEVGVERSLGLNSKKEIEEYGLAEFARRCKERVAEYGEVITEQCRRLGMWMDWDNDYYTFSDTNIEYIWRFLKAVHEKGWLYIGHRSVEWCPRCGTSLSQHELINSYEELTHPSLFVRFPLQGRDGESLVVWTTTPWTLPANVAAAVKPDAEYGLRRSGDWVAVERYPDDEFVRRVRGEELVGLTLRGPVRRPAGAGRDRASRDPVGRRHARRGHGHRAHRARRGRGGLRALEGARPPRARADRRGGSLPPRLRRVRGAQHGGGREAGRRRARAAGAPRRARLDHAPLPGLLALRDAARLPHRRRLADLVRRGPRADAAGQRGVEWTPDFYSKRMDDWLRNMGDWNISRRRYFGLPLPFYPCECGHLNVVGSLAELRERATAGLDQLEELHRPWIDEVTISCEACGRDVRRITEVGDAWLDAGIVPFSTLGWQNDEWREGGYATGASAGLSGADLPDHAYWEQWFPADWVSEMREQIRLWFYSISFMSVTLIGRSPYKAVLTYEKLQDETGREMHRSWGNSIDAAEALENMGADVIRWLFSEHVPSQNLRFGYGPAGEIKRRLLTLWNSVSFLVTYANIEGYRPDFADLASGPSAEGMRTLDRWLVARTRQLVAEATAAYEDFWTPGDHARLRRVRRRSLELVHPPLSAPLLRATTTRRSARSGSRSCRPCG